VARKILCADFEDIIYTSVNVGKKLRPNTGKELISEATKAKLKFMLRYEYDLYNHFSAKLRRQLKEMHVDLEVELRERKLAHQREEEKCQAILSGCAGITCLCNARGKPNVEYVRCRAFFAGAVYYGLRRNFRACLANRGVLIGH